MANYKGIVDSGVWSYTGRQQPHLPPKSPFPSVAATSVEYGPTHGTTPRDYEPREGQRLHQRTSSESRIIEEQPPWLDDLLNEPDTPVKKGGHRRSSSDSFAYSESPHNLCNVDHFYQMETMHRAAPLMTLGSSVDDSHVPFYTGANSFVVQPLNRRREPATNGRTLVSQKPSKSKISAASLDSVSTRKNGPSVAAESQKVDVSAPHEKTRSSQKEEGLHDDQKRVKQQFAQRSRVRKLQYIAELERTVQALQGERIEVSTELEFVDRQLLITSLENKALKQRLESVFQEQLVKRLEQEMLEREVRKLRMLAYQQHQERHYDQQASNSANRDLGLHFAALSLSQGQSNANM